MEAIHHQHPDRARDKDPDPSGEEHASQGDEVHPTTTGLREPEPGQILKETSDFHKNRPRERRHRWSDHHPERDPVPPRPPKLQRAEHGPAADRRQFHGTEGEDAEPDEQAEPHQDYLILPLQLDFS